MKTVKLKDISINNRGYYGIGASAVDYDENKFTYLRITDINDDGSLNKNGLMSVDDEKSDQYLLEKNDIVFARTGASTGRNYFYDGEINNMVYAGFLIKFSLNPELVNPKFVKYYCLSQKYKDWISSSLTGSTRPNINEKQLSEMPIELSDRFYQDKVVEILDSIAQKIQLNNETNNNLHDLCNNLYFKLVSQLNDTNSSVESIKNVAKCVLGGTPSRTKKDYWNGSINWINSGEINKFRIIKASEKITELGLNKSSTTLLPRGTTVLAITGATLGQVSRLEIDSCANQSVIGIITNEKELNNYMYLSILNSINDLVLKQTGGAQQHINKNDVETHEIIVPSTELISQFDEIIRPLFDQISVNCFEVNKLEQLRDTLLPKLMNGEIDLDSIEI